MSIGVETIVAPATPLGRSALAIVRIDGPRSEEILRSLTGAEPPPVRYAALLRIWRHSHITDTGRELLDEAVVIRYEAPASFTGNDLVEISLHGNPLLVEQVIEEVLRHGARLAEPGEFTERAVLNGKMDLVQAEAIGELIAARTSLQARISLANLEGSLSRAGAAVREILLEVIARFEAALDFSEEGYEFISREEARARLAEAQRRLEEMAGTYRRGRATRRGLEAVILGAPNAGKSTLLNRLVGSDRAIVTEIPGTTRDILRETIEIGGLPVTLADTAGLREAGDAVEQIGIARAREAAASADLVLYLVDGSAGLSPEDELELQALPDAVIVYTKSDLRPAPEGAVSISALSGAGVDDLLGLLDRLVRERFAAPEGALVTERQYRAVSETAEALEHAMASLVAGHEEQLLLVDLYRAAEAIGGLAGAIANDDVLAEIFGSFCIGK